jgi:hypothetical protein
VPRGSRRRAAARLGVEPESGSRSGDDLDGQGSPDGEREEGEETGGAGWAVGPGKEERSRLGRLGRLGREGRKEEKKEKADWARSCRRKGREGKKKEKVGRAKRDREGEKEMHLNLNLKFKYKWKTSNKTIQCGIKCTRSIFPYISFYG